MTMRLLDRVDTLLRADTHGMVNALEERLNLRGFKAKGVTTGAEALSHLRESECDVVLVDVKMPGLGGLALVKKTREERQRLGVILLTGHGSVQDAEEAEKLGVFDYLMKPVKIDNLVKALHSAAARK